MIHNELRNAINNACDTMRREGLTTMDYMEHSNSRFETVVELNNA